MLNELLDICRMQNIVLKPLSLHKLDLDEEDEKDEDGASDRWQDESVPDAHLLMIQVCRATLAAGLLMSVLACVTTMVDTPRIRLQCALAATACAVSSLFYRHLYELRRLPNYYGYSEEANSVSNALRYTSWAVTIALLAWIALLLRGPFHEEKIMGWTYNQWLYIGPLLATTNVLMGIPGWEAARVFSNQKGCSVSRIGAFIISAVLLMGGLLISVILNYALRAGSTKARSTSESTLANWVAGVWIAYPALQCLKTLAVFFGKDHVPRLTNIAKRYAPITKTKNALQFAFRTMVGAPNTHIRETHNLYTMIEPEHSIDVKMSKLSAPTIQPRWTQLLDTIMATVDIFSQGILALILVTYALPT